MIFIIITRGQCRNREATSLSQHGKNGISYLANEMSRLFGNMNARFYTSESTSDKLSSIIFARGLHSKKGSKDYTISTIENELTKESISVVDWFSEFRGGDTYVDAAKIENLLKDLEAKGVKIAWAFLSRDRAQQWTDVISGKHTNRLPASSAAVIDTSCPKNILNYGQQLELEKAQRDEVRKQIEDSMYKAIGLVKRNL